MELYYTVAILLSTIVAISICCVFIGRTGPAGGCKGYLVHFKKKKEKKKLDMVAFVTNSALIDTLLRVLKISQSSLIRHLPPSCERIVHF